MFLLSLSSLLLTTFATAARLSVSIPPTPQLHNPSTLPSNTHAVLLGPSGIHYDVLLRRSNTFQFPELQPAEYLLTVHCRDYFFPPLRIDVTSGSGGEGKKEVVSAWQTFRGNEWSNKGPGYGSSETGELNIQIAPSGGKDFYQTRGGFNVLSFLKSPMILMGLVSVVFIFGLPYVMENMDPETRAEFEEMQKKGTGPGQAHEAVTNSMQNFDLAGWMAGKGQGSGGGSGKKK